MHYQDLNEEEQKIMNLLYTGTIPNDRLALEIIKSYRNDKPFFAPLLSIAMTTEDKNNANDILEFLEPQLTLQQKDYVKRNIEQYNYTTVYQQSLRNNFSLKDCVEICYTNFRRTGQCINDFLCVDDGTHPDRNTVFEKMINNEKKISDRHIYIAGLMPDEMKIYLEKVFSTSTTQTFETLRLDSLKSDEIPEILFTRNYREIQIVNHPNQTNFPSYIFNFSKAKKINLELLADWDIPLNWGKLYELTEINFGGKDYVFDNFDFIRKLIKLRTLFISQHYVSHPNVLLQKRAVPLAGHIQFKSSKGFFSGKNYRNAFVLSQDKAISIAGALGKSILSDEEQSFYFIKLANLKQLKNLEKLPLNELMALMNVSYAGLRSIIQGQLDELSEAQNGIATLKEKSLLYIAGTPERKKSEIKKKLKELNISLASKPSEEITHLMVCKMPKDYKVLIDRGLELVSEQALYKMLKADAPGFIEEATQSGDTLVSDNILQLIYSNEVTNVVLGLEMLKNGGVPENLVEPLLVVFKTCPDTKARGVAKKLLLANASAELLPLINDSQRFTNINTKVKAQEINRKLEKIAKTSSRELAARMSLLFHDRYKKGLRYILYHFKKPCEERTRALLAMMEGTHFDFHAGLGFTTWHGKNPEGIALYNMKAPARFPIDVIDHVPLIESANFHNCKFATVPKAIGKMKDLKKLDLSYNFLSSIPDSVEKMIQLEHLDLRMNQFESFPMALVKLPNLKVLDLRYNRINHEFEPLQINDEIRNSLKDCEILV